ncbi:MAG TPA: gliding-motility protein MglA [Candidatus Saccharimonadales bacterium]|nr:gliding-motility protein MglA [Candidatus Saccharimonadales bacterium]
MALVNYFSREIQFKVVYYGPGLGGKTTNLTYIHAHTSPQYRGNLVSLKTQEERTLFFDFLPVSLGEVGGYRARFHLYTVPGQMIYQASRRVILQGVDGVVFVADSSPDRQDGNRASLRDLVRTLDAHKLPLRGLPLVYQWNKRDVPGALPVERLAGVLNPWGRPAFPSVAVSGEGVMETVKGALRAVLHAFQEEAAAQPPAPMAESQVRA